MMLSKGWSNQAGARGVLEGSHQPPRRTRLPVDSDPAGLPPHLRQPKVAAGSKLPAGSHSWRLPTLVPSGEPQRPLPESRSTPALPPASKEGAAVTAGAGMAIPFQSAALRCELRLREQLQASVEAGVGVEARRQRALAVVQALQEVSRMVSPASTFMPLLAKELLAIALSDRVGGGRGGRGAGGAARLFYFEVVNDLEAELRAAAEGVRDMEARVEEERERCGEVEAEAAALRRTIGHKEDAMASMTARLSQHDARIAEHERRYQLLQVRLRFCPSTKTHIPSL